VAFQQVGQGAVHGIAVLHFPSLVGLLGAVRRAGIDRECLRRVGPRNGHRPRNDIVDLLVDLLLDAGDLRLGHRAGLRQGPPRRRQGIAKPVLFHLLGTDVGRLIIGRVALEPDGHAFEDHRLGVGLHQGQRLADLVVDGPGVRPSMVWPVIP
jgi:hypothetical protein